MSEDLLLQLDLGFRTAASAIVIVAGFVFCRAWFGQNRCYLAAFIAFLLPAFLFQMYLPDDYWRFGAQIVSSAIPGAIWLLIRSDMSEDVEIDWSSWGLLLGLLPLLRVLWMFSELFSQPMLGQFSWWCGYVFMAGLIFVIVRAAVLGVENELIEHTLRVKRRVFLLFALGIFAAMVHDFSLHTLAQSSVVSDIFLDEVGAGAVDAAFSGLFLAVVFYACTSFLTTNIDGLVNPRPLPERPPSVSQISSEARADIQKLNALMTDERVFLQSDLSVPSLAKLVKVPEYRLRQLINQELGYRNFYGYLNFYRVTEAEKRLADPELRRTPVLSIAMDVGYRSIGSFNKAFKDRTGQTPTEYRRGALDDDPG